MKMLIREYGAGCSKVGHRDGQCIIPVTPTTKTTSEEENQRPITACSTLFTFRYPFFAYAYRLGEECRQKTV